MTEPINSMTTHACAHCARAIATYCFSLEKVRRLVLTHTERSTSHLPSRGRTSPRGKHGSRSKASQSNTGKRGNTVPTRCSFVTLMVIYRRSSRPACGRFTSTEQRPVPVLTALQLALLNG